MSAFEAVCAPVCDFGSGDGKQPRRARESRIRANVAMCEARGRDEDHIVISCSHYNRTKILQKVLQSVLRCVILDKNRCSKRRSGG